MFNDLKNKRVILTGGLGFFGKQIIDAYYKEGSKIIVIDNKKKIYSKNLITTLVIFVMKEFNFC